MKIYAIKNQTSFEARIKINKSKIETAILKRAGVTSVSGGSSSILTAGASGSDMTVHNIESSIPIMQNSTPLFDQFAQLGHKAFKIFENGYEHNGYDASFFSTSMSTSGTLTYMQGMNNIVNAINREFRNKIPT